MAAEIRIMEEAATDGIKAMEDFFRYTIGARILKGNEEDSTFIARLDKYVSFSVSYILRDNGIDVKISQF